MLGGPRTLQALAKDRILPKILSNGSGEQNTPRLATVVTFVIALVALVLGDLNAIAPVLSMFFLTSYGVLNFSAAMEGMINSPSWRPSFRVPYVLSLVGAFACFAIMFMIDAGATFIALFLTIAVYLVTQYRQVRSPWDDIRRGIMMFFARYSIYRLAKSRPNPKSWRPHFLVFSGSPSSRMHLIQLAHSIAHGKGFFIVSAIIKSQKTEDQQSNFEKTMYEYLKKRDITALVHVLQSDDIFTGLKSIVLNYGLGPIVPNTFLFGDTQNPEHFEKFAELVRLIVRQERNIVIVKESPEDSAHAVKIGKKRKIDVWWGRERQNAGFMLALGYMLQTSPDWEGCEMTLKTVVSSEEQSIHAQKYLVEYLESSRLDVGNKVLVNPDVERVFEVIQQESESADLVFLGLRPPLENESNEEYSAYYQRILNKTKSMQRTAFVIASEKMQFNKIFSGSEISET
jgi:hypothetical protein